jgi:hypothetical protein
MSSRLPDKAEGTVSVVSFVPWVSCLPFQRCHRKKAIRDWKCAMSVVVLAPEKTESRFYEQRVLGLGVPPPGGNIP